MLKRSPDMHYFGSKGICMRERTISKKDRPAYGNSWQGRSTGIRDQESSWEYVCRQKSTHTFLGGKRSFYEKNTYILLGQFISIDDIVSG